jgi:hypothetical protein
MAMYKEPWAVVIQSCIIDWRRAESKVSPSVGEKETEYKTTPDHKQDVRKRTLEGSKERLSFNDDTN